MRRAAGRRRSGGADEAVIDGVTGRIVARPDVRSPSRPRLRTDARRRRAGASRMGGAARSTSDRGVRLRTAWPTVRPWPTARGERPRCRRSRTVIIRRRGSARPSSRSPRSPPRSTPICSRASPLPSSLVLFLVGCVIFFGRSSTPSVASPRGRDRHRWPLLPRRHRPAARAAAPARVARHRGRGRIRHRVGPAVHEPRLRDAGARVRPRPVRPLGRAGTAPFARRVSRHERCAGNFERLGLSEQNEAMAEQATEHITIDAPPHKCWRDRAPLRALPRMGQGPQGVVRSRDGSDRPQEVEFTAAAMGRHELHASLRLLRGPGAPGLVLVEGDIMTPARRRVRLHAVGTRSRRPTSSTSLDSSRRAAARLRRSAGPRCSIMHTLCGAEEPRESSTVVTLGSCCSPARAASARPRRGGDRAALRRLPGSHARPLDRSRPLAGRRVRRAARRAAHRDRRSRVGPAARRAGASWRSPGARSSAYLIDVFDWAGVEAIEAEELSVFPGLDEVFASATSRPTLESGRLGRDRRRLRADRRDAPAALPARGLVVVHGPAVPAQLVR